VPEPMVRECPFDNPLPPEPAHVAQPSADFGESANVSAFGHKAVTVKTPMGWDGTLGIDAEGSMPSCPQPTASDPGHGGQQES
jgi:hypothetical protein